MQYSHYMRFSRAREAPVRRAGAEHWLWKEKLQLENRSNAVYLLGRSIERSIAEGRVAAGKAPQLLLRETLDPSPFFRTVAAESPLSIYDKLPSVAYRNPEVKGQRRAYIAPWASSCLQLTDEVPLLSPSKAKFTREREEERLLTLRRQRDVSMRLSMASKS